MLGIESLTTRYGAITAVRDVELTVRAGEIVCLIGPNGAGKTTLLSTISGLLKPSTGRVVLDGNDVTGWAPDQMLRSGLALVPEHRRIFADFTVRENLMVGGVTQTASRREQLFDEITSLFPILKERLYTQAGFLSGGEAQQLAIGRALMSDPNVLLMDEPSLGLAPVLVDQVFELIGKLREGGRTLFVVEQNAQRMLSVADRAYVMRSGSIVTAGPAAELRGNEELFKTYLGRSGGAA
ncbi:MAG: ABC transporter ATP-binding protein [Arenicellales bacterium]|jgi:branched-chain amino acid transport system ATP-binding protein|nr:branched-chain amino acid ABC transporter ATP-binding protein [Acidiferrobacteraceae bacterium]MDP6122890.1 ABC transporter ATP-binding protein [Arenicellales bacterium]MBT57960.1 branched-chain amino acid ABC transporter ATP-binding protein [Acidiferrobacteraceae bacterium]MDP6288765.1 ABC transporter ATP-binding protein [Arenicellales bacterium]MDP6434432.1 ABC transporter ATP-binding protein [Arenicellales bacterium]|tara:strand:+ start:3935 stop:4651 length:717 start_codon:yes stop_codon:yes gene_type:complete